MVPRYWFWKLPCQLACHNLTRPSRNYIKGHVKFWNANLVPVARNKLNGITNNEHGARVEKRDNTADIKWGGELG
jgi:hypothetical protein